MRYHFFWRWAMGSHGQTAVGSVHGSRWRFCLFLFIPIRHLQIQQIRINCNKMIQSPAGIVDKMMMSLMEIAVIFDTRQLLQIEHQRSSVRIVRQEIRFQLLILMQQKMLPGWDTDNSIRTPTRGRLISTLPRPVVQSISPNFILIEMQRSIQIQPNNGNRWTVQFQFMGPKLGFDFDLRIRWRWAQILRLWTRTC